MTMDSRDTEGVMFILFQLERDVDRYVANVGWEDEVQVY